MRYLAALFFVLSAPALAESCRTPANSSKVYVTNASLRDAWLNTINSPARRLPADSQSACNAQTSFCFPATVGRFLTLSEIGVQKAKAPDSSLTLLTIRFPDDIKRPNETVSAKQPCNTNSVNKWCNADELFELLSKMLATSPYSTSQVKVVIASGEYRFRNPATAASVKAPSIKLRGLRNVTIEGERLNRPKIIFSNPMGAGIEIHDSQRLTLRDLEFDYDYAANFNDFLDPLKPGWFRRIPYETSFYEAQVTDDQGEFELLHPTPRDGLETNFRAGFQFWFDATKLTMPYPGAPHYFVRGGATDPVKADMVVFGKGLDENNNGRLEDDEQAFTPGSATYHYRHPSIRKFTAGTTITLGKRRDGYMQAIYVRDVADPDYELRGNEDLIFERIRLVRYPQMGFVFQGGKRVRLAEVVIEPDEGQNHSGRADALHLQGVSDLELEANRISGQGDDGLNIRGVTSFATSLAYSTCQSGTTSFPTVKIGLDKDTVDSALFNDGDEVALVNNQGVPLLSGLLTNVVRDRAVKRPSEATIELTNCNQACLVEIQRIISRSQFSSADPVALFNLSRSGARYYVHGTNRFQFSASRGLLINSPHGIIEDSVVMSLPGGGMRLQAENNAAGITGPGAINVVARRNLIKNVGYDVSVHPLYAGAIGVGTPDGGATTLPANDVGLESPLVQRIILQDNEISGAGQAAVVISRAARVEATWSDPTKVYLSKCFQTQSLTPGHWGSTTSPYKVPVAVRNATSVRFYLEPSQYVNCGL